MVANTDDFHHVGATSNTIQVALGDDHHVAVTHCATTLQLFDNFHIRLLRIDTRLKCKAHRVNTTV